MGSVVAACEGSCARDAVRDAIRMTAGRLGADDVAGVSCVEADEGWTCTGVAGVYEREPELIAR
jgi:hypothetical protein